MTNTKTPVLLNCSSTGIEKKPNLVILHGLFGDLNNWRAIADRFSDTFRVHCMDLRNHGDSPHTSGMTYAEMAADVAHTCQSLKISSTHVIGHSMGGKTAMQLALSSTELVDRLAVVDIGPRQYERHHDSILEGLQILSVTPVKSRKEADKILQPFTTDANVRSFLLKNLTRCKDGSYRLRVNIDEIIACYNDIANSIQSTRQYDAPVLFIKGAESDYLTEADREPIAGLFSNPSLKTIDGAGHWPHSEKPDVIYKVLADFFAAG